MFFFSFMSKQDGPINETNHNPTFWSTTIYCILRNNKKKLIFKTQGRQKVEKKVGLLVKQVKIRSTFSEHRL